MDLILLILTVSKQPLLASELAPLLGRDVTNVRASLALLASQGLAQREQVSDRGPQGTFRWRATPTGRTAAAELAAWFRGQLR